MLPAERTSHQAEEAHMRLSDSRSKCLIGAVAIACAVALAPVTAPSAAASQIWSAGSASTGSTPRCTTSALVVWMNTEGFGYAGGFVYSLEFTNLSGHRCILSGYPGVSAVGLGGQRLGLSAARGVSPVGLVSLANGATTTAALNIEDVRHFSTAACHQVMAAGLLVYPPHQPTFKLIPFPFDACSARAIV